MQACPTREADKASESSDSTGKCERMPSLEAPRSLYVTLAAAERPLADSSSVLLLADARPWHPPAAQDCHYHGRQDLVTAASSTTTSAPRSPCVSGKRHASHGRAEIGGGGVVTPGRQQPLSLCMDGTPPHTLQLSIPSILHLFLCSVLYRLPSQSSSGPSPVAARPATAISVRRSHFAQKLIGTHSARLR